MKILHLAVENFAGIPFRLVQEERRRGHESRLITLLPSAQKYEEDIALRLPWSRLPQLQKVRSWIRGSRAQMIDNLRHQGRVKYWQPANVLDVFLFRMRDALWMPTIQRALRGLGGLESFDVIIADGGHDCTRFPRLLAETSVPIITCYYGSDVRVRGIIDGVQRRARYTWTFEYDHTLLLPSAEFLLYPYTPPVYAPKVEYIPPQQGDTIRVGHAPTNRAAKGTKEIMSVLRSLQSEFPIEIIMIEGVSHREALHRKATCHCFIDQIGELGYGVNALESLAMGIPTAVELMPDFERYLQEYCGEAHPFYMCRRKYLEDDLRAMLNDMAAWRERGKQGQRWVGNHHSVAAVVERYLPTVEQIVQQSKNSLGFGSNR
ncbi:MAG: glycosyltransferase [Bacteroidota bacterium]|nr:glycosyltransferase [Candidatus Kapabacteria bacterium]MDW8219590.1 glycosyltransferase [Bacteroidota bacterium]